MLLSVVSLNDTIIFAITIYLLPFSVGFAVGPALSSTLVSLVGFGGLCTTTAFVCFCFAPCMLMLRKPPGKNEDKILLNEGSVKYVSYTNEETPEEDNSKPKAFEMVP